MEEVKKGLADLGYSKDQIKIAMDAINGIIINPTLYQLTNESVIAAAKYEELVSQLGALAGGAQHIGLSDSRKPTVVAKKEAAKPRAPRVKKEEPKRYSAGDGPGEEAEEETAEVTKPVLEL